MKFKYKFEAIKRIKETLEKKTQRELGEIDMHIHEAEADIEKLENTIKALHMEVAGKQFVRASELHHMTRYEEYLEEKIKALDQLLQSLFDQRTKKMEELQQRQKEHRIFETLEEKKYQEFLVEANRIEQIAMDETAAQKFLRSES